WRAIADTLMPSTRMLGRAALPATGADACLFDVAPSRGYRVSPCSAVLAYQRAVRSRRTSAPQKGPTPQTRLCGPIPRLDDTCVSRRRTAVSRYPALRSPDLPRCLRTAIARLAPLGHCNLRQ